MATVTYPVRTENLIQQSVVDAALARAEAAERRLDDLRKHDAELDQHLWRHAVAILKRCKITRARADDLIEWLMAEVDIIQRP